MRYHLFQKFCGKMVKIKETSFLSTRGRFVLLSIVAHCFMTTEGIDKNERVEKTLVNIGPAVFNGGFSTFLAFILLINSK